MPNVVILRVSDPAIETESLDINDHDTVTTHPLAHRVEF